MHIVTVEFDIHPQHVESFKVRVLQQAADSLENEEGCKVFDVAVSLERPYRMFLYEVYDNSAAFQIHLESPHFKAFDRDVAEYVRSKKIQVFNKLALSAVPD